jgi:uncharacterized membrane protein YwaF
VVNLLVGSNYLYLRHTPDVPNLLDLLGAWPWYIVAAAVLALLIFTGLDLPFSMRRRRAPQGIPQGIKTG